MGYIKLLDVDDKRLLEISEKGLLSLNLNEMRLIQTYFKKLKREPTQCELETIAQTWSEHCCHKTFKARVEYFENGRKVLFKNIFKDTIVKTTRDLNKKWCVSVFDDNAGIIKFDKNWNVAFKVETHNHPSALEPYGGASTGIGGVIRDILGVGLCAKPLFNTDVFCFANPDFNRKNLPDGILHPSRIFKGVVSGVRDYGNRMGIPTVNGAIVFNDYFLYNPLVYCGTLGILPSKAAFKKIKAGDLIVLIGGKTGRDGIHGATFSSINLKKNTEASVVQIGNPIVEKKVMDALIKARDKKLFNSVTDCGAGGLSSAIGELAKECGAIVELSKVPLKYRGMKPWEIWLSEAQERMVISVSPKKLGDIIKLFDSESVEATVIGKFTNTRKLYVDYKKKRICNLSMDFLHNKIPMYKLNGKWIPKIHPEPDFYIPKNLTAVLLKLLSSPTIASKERVIRQYDHEVQGRSVLKPLQGKGNGPGDASIVKPLFTSKKGIAVSNGINPLYSQIDTYWMAASCIDEALRNIIAVGGDLERIALLDNFCWGEVKSHKSIGELVRALTACYNIAKVYGTPFISGKDSLNNRYGNTDILPTLLISAVCVINDINKVISMDFKKSDNLIYIVGNTYNELGGSKYFEMKGFIGNSVPKVNPSIGKKLMKKISYAIRRGFIKSCHDISEGGIAVALSEMCFSGDIGAVIELEHIPRDESVIRDDYALFSESNTRFIVEVDKKYRRDFEKLFNNLPCKLCGIITKKPYLIIKGINKKAIIKADVNKLKKSWCETIKW